MWHGDTCWDLFQNQCSSGSGGGFIQTIKFLKDVKSLLVKGDGVENVFKAFFVCKPLIEDCIAPQLRNCRDTCQIDTMVFAPDISVGHPEGSLHGVVYDENNKQLYFKVVNNGLSYVWDIDVEATYAHTPSRDQISPGNQLFKEKIDELIYLGARNGPPKTLTDYVTDFLIDEAKQGQFFQGFKNWLLSDKTSDSKNYNVPNYWMKAVPFEPKAGELNRIVFKVDGANTINETSELNNTFTLDIDLRPTPAQFQIENFLYKRVSQTLTSFMVSFQVRNTGEESGAARVAIYEGKYETGKTPLTQTEQIVQGKNVFLFDENINIDISKEQKPYCGKLKQYQLVVTDDEGNKTVRSFTLPIYLGTVSGRVTDLFGKKIVGATVTSSSGQETKVNDSGFYHLEGVNTLGQVTITASHPKYSQPELQEVQFNIDNEINPCIAGSLAFYSVNFILKDKPVNWKVVFKDEKGNDLSGSVIASNNLFRHTGTLDGEKVFPDLQPGEYDATFMVPGYYPQFRKVILSPPETVTEVVFEKLAGRENDEGLGVISPRLLWKKQLGDGGGFIDQMSATKNGKLLVVSLSNNKTKESRLFFIDPLSGKIIKENQIPYFVSNQKTLAIDASYDGRTVGVFFNTGAPGKTDKDKVVKLYSASGAEIGTTIMGRKSSIFLDVALDGFYLFPNALLNSSLHKYTRKEVEGVGDGRDLQGYGSFVFFRRNGNLISHCKGSENGWCERSISDIQISKIGDTYATPQIMDESYDGTMLAIRTHEGIYAFGQSTWSHEFRREPSFTSMSVSPGGMYIMVTGREENSAVETLKIYGNTGGDKTPGFKYDHVRFVSANDKGMFFAQVKSDKIEYYQAGAYRKDYNAPATSATDTKGTNFLTNFFSFIKSAFKNFAGMFSKKP